MKKLIKGILITIGAIVVVRYLINFDYTKNLMEDLTHMSKDITTEIKDIKDTVENKIPYTISIEKKDTTIVGNNM